VKLPQARYSITPRSANSGRRGDRIAMPDRIGRIRVVPDIGPRWPEGSRPRERAHKKTAGAPRLRRTRARPTGVSQTPERLSALRSPSIRVSEAKVQNPGAKRRAAGARRCVLFDEVRWGWTVPPHPEEARSAVSKDRARDPLPSCFETPRVRAAPQHEGGRGYASRARGGRSLFSPVIYRETAPHASCAGLTRASIFFAKSFLRRSMDCRVKPRQ